MLSTPERATVPAHPMLLTLHPPQTQRARAHTAPSHAPPSWLTPAWCAARPPSARHAWPPRGGPPQWAQMTAGPRTPGQGHWRQPPPPAPGGSNARAVGHMSGCSQPAVRIVCRHTAGLSLLGAKDRPRWRFLPSTPLSRTPRLPPRRRTLPCASCSSARQAVMSSATCSRDTLPPDSMPAGATRSWVLRLWSSRVRSMSPGEWVEERGREEG